MRLSFVLPACVAVATGQVAWASDNLSAQKRGAGPTLPYDPKTNADCTWWFDNDNNTPCDTILSNNYITLDEFRGWNPSIGSQCEGLQDGHSYCVEGPEVSLPETTSTSTTTSSSTTSKPVVTEKPTKTSTTSSAKPSSTKPSNGIETPQPTQPKMVDNCDQFYYVKLGDTCDSIVAKFGITVNDFKSWNQAVGDKCSGLWADTYACVKVIGYKPTPTKPSNGIETPSPTQPGMINYCRQFYFVKPGDSCADIAKNNYISLNDFLKWNPKADNDCKGLWANAYACVGDLWSVGLVTRYHADCTGDVHNLVSIPNDGSGQCISTDCSVASLEIFKEGMCADGEVRISYWEKGDCTGRWFGYGYASRDTCRPLWSEGWKFKGLFLRCAPKSTDCVTQGTCKEDPEPNGFIC